MKNSPIKRATTYLTYLATVHVAALFLFFIFRFILYHSVNYQFPATIDHDLPLKSIAFVRGLWFDNVIACYILLLPLTVMWIAALCHYTSKGLFKFTAFFFTVFYSLAFAITAANIPYFCYFFKTINSSIYNWFGYGATTAGMMVGEPSYYFPILLGLAAILSTAWCIFKISNRFYNTSLQANGPLPMKQRLLILVAGAGCIGLCLFGIRGRMGYNPIKVSQAYYCQDPFLNQLGVNPVFNLLTSTLDDLRKENRYLHLMPEQEAVKQAQNFLNRQGIADISPLARRIEAPDNPLKKNIVFIFMESMSAHLMEPFGATGKLTPFLDSLYHESLTFSNFYSAGIHTNHGMYSTLYSFPTIMKRNAMKGSVIPLYSGLPTILKENGYRNLFFMTHESQYDNMNAFFRSNGFDEVYAQEDYPKEKVVNSFGVQDDFLYQYALPILNERAQSGQPFFSVLLSISNHPPYVIPAYFQPRSANKEEQIVEYADWAIRQFMTEARKQPWFEETIFVFMADHGKLVGTPECEMPQSYNHIPLMIYGKDIQPAVCSAMGGQVDVAPTLLGLLNISYTQNNFGIDLLKEQRPCMFYTADNLIAARDTSRLYIYSPESRQEFRYHYQGRNVQAAPNDTLFDKLKEYCFSMLQSTEHLVKQGKITNHPSDSSTPRNE